MSAQPVKNVSASVKNRILSMARQSGKPFQSLLTHYGLERFLFRMSRSPLKEKFVLKGGLLLMGMGLGMGEITGVSKETIRFAREKAGDGPIDAVVASIPGLGQFV